MDLCDHPLCEQQRAGVHARKRPNEYCSDRCRYLHGCILRQAARRESGIDKEVTRARRLMQKYGITVEDWDRLYDEQLGRCGICMTPLAEVKVCVDHDHETGAVRGLLCNRCNQGLGYFLDSSAMLMRAVLYIDSAAIKVGGEVQQT